VSDLAFTYPINPDWKFRSLEDICESIFDCPHSTPKLVEHSDFFMVRTQDIRNGFFDMSSAVFVSEDAYVERTKRAIPTYGDVLLSREGTYFGDAAEVPENTNVCLGQRMVLLRPKKDFVKSSFLRLWINSEIFQRYLLGFRDGTVAERLNVSTIRKLPIPLPAIKEQEQILAHFLPLEQKEALNRQINTTLESMAQTLFKSWFVDFDPVLDNALVAGNPIPDALAERAATRKVLGDARKPLPEDIRQLFPATFVWAEEMGWIPEGWEPTSLSDLISIKHGFAFKGEYFSPSPTKDILLTPGNFKIGGGFKYDKLKYYAGPIPEDYVLSKADLLVTMTDLSKAVDTLGFPTFVPDNSELRFLHNQRLGKVDIQNQQVGKHFIYRCLCSKAYRDEVLSSLTGTTVKHTSPKKILAFQVPFSGSGIEALFDEQCIALTVKQQQCNQNDVALSKLRDTLLPKLLSGELRIPEAEKLVEEAL